MVLVLVEQTEGKVTDPSLQTLTLARSFAQPVHALLVGSAADLTQHGVAVVHVAEHVALGAFIPEAWASILGELADRLEANAVFAAGTERGNEVMARLAARTGLPLAANCTAASPGPPVTLTRLRWGGRRREIRTGAERPGPARAGRRACRGAGRRRVADRGEGGGQRRSRGGIE